MSDHSTPDEKRLLDDAVRRLRTDRWIPLREFSVGYAAKAALAYPETKHRSARKRNVPLRVDLLLVSRGTDRPEDAELERYKEWPGRFGYKKFNPDAPDWKGDDDSVFLSEMSRLLRQREVMIVECKALEEREIGEYGPHSLFHAVGQALLYQELFIEDFDQGSAVKRVGTAALVNEFYSVEKWAFERARERAGDDRPPFSTRVWDTSFADKEFFV